jgi:hypothetical protein
MQLKFNIFWQFFLLFLRKFTFSLLTFFSAIDTVFAKKSANFRNALSLLVINKKYLQPELIGLYKTIH